MMDTVSRVKNASSPLDALMAIAQAIDNVYTAVDKLSNNQPLSDWGASWTNDGQIPEEYVEGEEVVPFAVEENPDGSTTVELPEVTLEMLEARKEFIEQIELPEHLQGSYKEGGAWWLYVYDRDFVMGLPEDARRHMVEEVTELSPDRGLEMGRDVLKDQSPGPGPKSLDDV